MELILLEKIRNLGDLGELVNVKPGYARNFLVPHGKAVFASEGAKEKVDAARRRLAAEDFKRVEVAQARADLSVREITITRLANAEGYLYGSVVNADVAAAMNTAMTTGQAIEKSEVHLAGGPFKKVGQYRAEIALHPEVRFDMLINIEGKTDETSTAVAAESNAESAAQSQTEREITQFENRAEANIEEA